MSWPGHPPRCRARQQPPRSRVRRVFSGSRDLARIVYRDPEHVSERLTLYAADRLADPSRGVGRVRAELSPRDPPGPDRRGTADAVGACGADRRCDRRDSVLRRAGARLPDVSAAGDAHDAAHGRALRPRPEQLQTAAEMLALRGVHSNVEAAEAALTAVREKAIPDRPATRRSLAHLGSQRLPAARVRRLHVPVGRPTRTKADAAGCKAAFGVLFGVAIWATTWVFPVTFMIAMAWGCETHARQLGRRTLLYYDGEAASVLRRDRACRSTPRPWPRQTRDPSRGRPVSVGRCSDRLHRLCRSGSPHHRGQLARCPRCARRALARDRDGCHLKPEVGRLEARDPLAPNRRDRRLRLLPGLMRDHRGAGRLAGALGPRQIARTGDRGQRRGQGRGGDSASEQLATRVRPARVR